MDISTIMNVMNVYKSSKSSPDLVVVDILLELYFSKIESEQINYVPKLIILLAWINYMPTLDMLHQISSLLMKNTDWIQNSNSIVITGNAFSHLEKKVAEK